MKGVALKLPDDLFEAVEAIAESEFDGNRNRAIEACLRKGLRYESWETEWESASALTRVRWAVVGRPLDDEGETG